ncbi:MAG: alpha/beta hydrolase [Cyclobacteriaceae bacterium]
MTSHTLNYPGTKHRKTEVNGTTIFYRESGNPDAETILMLHGFPSSSHMFRTVIEKLSDRYHLVAPDYPGFGFSDTPPPDAFEYTFDHIADVMDEFIKKLKPDAYYLMMQDYGGPIGLRIASRHPDKIKGLIVQNANTYLEGLGEWSQKIGEMEKAEDYEGITKLKDWFMSTEGLKAMYVAGASDPSKVDPISYLTDEAFLRREGINEIQTTLFADYGNNFPKYEEWQSYLRKHQPPTLIIWGVNDRFFTKEGAKAYTKDVKKADVHLFEGDHFVLEEYADEAAALIRDFIG